jgi:hypothetical protein
MRDPVPRLRSAAIGKGPVVPATEKPRRPIIANTRECTPEFAKTGSLGTAR